MKSDIRGCSACSIESESYERFLVKIGRKTVSRVQYDYRSRFAGLFSCVAPDVEAARAKRDLWLEKNQAATGEFPLIKK
jgi:hypothetical protein